MIPILKPILLDNQTCAYCGISLTDLNKTKEHVIGRRFVPKGVLDGKWNLILNACKTCNNRKSKLEDDLSAVTMQPDPSGRYARNEQKLKEEARRKGQHSVSLRTGKPVSDSFEEITVTQMVGPGMEAKISFVTSPQADVQRVLDLALFHIRAMFYNLTYDSSNKTGRFWPGGFFGLAATPVTDWGNPLHRAFIDTVVTWEPRIIGGSADGFFKAAIRRHPDPEILCWSWALEWNAKMRTFGFFGHEEPMRTIVTGFPRIEMQTISEGPDHHFAIRVETPLPEEEDRLFYWDKFES